MFLVLALALGAAACAEEPSACIAPEPAHFNDAAFGAIIVSEGCRDAASDPYAVGSRATFSVSDGSESSFETSDPSVLEVSPLPDGRVQVSFLAAGSATLSARSPVDGSLVARLDLEARPVERVEWQVGAVLFGSAPVTGTPNVAVGGRVPVLTTLYAGGRQLRGEGVLELRAGPAEIRRGARTNADWLVLTPETEGPTVIEVSAGEVIARYSIMAVSTDAISRVELRPDEDGYAGVDDLGEVRPDVPSVYAQAYLADGAPVFGAPVEWSLDDESVEARGDVFQYELDPANTQTLWAQIGDARVSVPIHATGPGGARVLSGDELACDASGDPAAGLSMLALVMLALLVVSRRRAMA
ncbi:MAG: hypothetical protein GXP55_22875 [Deltaproteobacteria bacterium]|nr:hypothetical protein [Deltaproteobacteria bacterium]